MTGSKRRFCFQKGKFFVLAQSQSKSGKWIALGPDRYITIPFTILLLAGSILVSYIFQYTESPQLAYAILITYIITIVSYLRTSLFDPGIIHPSEDNSLENKSILEPQGYTYCSVCGLYRPPRAYHCSECNVCFYEHDHHCTFMGQCVAKNNTFSFYVFIVSLLIWLVLTEVCGMTLLAMRPAISKRSATSLLSILKKSIANSHLRSEYNYLLNSYPLYTFIIDLSFNHIRSLFIIRVFLLHSKTQ